jgi:hypothetical protein
MGRSGFSHTERGKMAEAVGHKPERQGKAVPSEENGAGVAPTGAIIASGLAMGKPVAVITQLYLDIDEATGLRKIKGAPARSESS